MLCEGKSTCIFLWLQIVVVADAALANRVLGTQEGLSKGLEPDGSDKLLSHGGHRTMFSSDTNSPYWRLIRKGTAPAFIQKNIKCAPLSFGRSLTPGCKRPKSSAINSTASARALWPPPSRTA